MSILISIATYNEMESLPQLVDHIFHVLPASHVLIVDDNSPDGTGRWVDERARDDPRLLCLHRAGKQGLGTATIAGLRHAIQQDYQFVVTMDGDHSHNPDYLPQLIAAMDPPDAEARDVVIGSRYVPGGGVQGWPVTRRWMSWAINFYARLLLRLTTRDCSGAFRCYRTATLRAIDFDRFRSRGYAFSEEMLWRLQTVGARFGEIPIVFVNRTAGASKISLHEATHALRVITKLGLCGDRK